MTKKENNNNWFETWFDSPFYHILYKDRDDTEAQFFITNLLKFLKPPQNSFLLDVACGKGRHAIYMNQLGYNVDGYDLSKNSIGFAKQYERNNLHFYVNDIRTPLNKNSYHYAFNLFTSFGYFSDENDNFKAIKAITESLVKNGVLVIDFMNVDKVIENLVPNEIKVVNDIEFNIKRAIENDFIVKTISFNHDQKEYVFCEKVKIIPFSNFKNYFEHANLTLQSIFGDYSLKPYNKEKSDRLILVLKK